jgi:hypothetical protein
MRHGQAGSDHQPRQQRKLAKESGREAVPAECLYGDVQGRKIMNLMGSNGMKAVALGADGGGGDGC